MAEIIRMPKLSDTMTEGVVAEWHKNIGDKVESGELLAEIETDKATMEFESFYDGVLLHIGIQKGETADVDALLCILGDEGEDISAILKEAESAPAAAPAEEKPAATPAPQQAASIPSPAPAPTPAPTPVPAPAAVAAPSSNGRLKASPLAKKMAEDKGIDLSTVAGSGDHGRIVKRDIENYTAPAAAPAAAPLSITPMTVAGQEGFTDERVSQMRKTISRRLGESKFSAPHFYLTVSIDMDNAVAARKQVNARDDVRISFNDMVIKAAAAALKKHPAVNASWMEDHIRYNHHVHIGVAVAVPDGLLVPVVKFADSKPMSFINAEVRELAGKAKSKKLQPDEMTGNTFTISNLGMFGIEEFTAIINPPDSCIMAVGGINQVPVVKNGEVKVGNVMKVTLSCDHRVVDGATGASFLQDFKAMLENPVLMLV
ncbi:MAG: pyruvate dehydrogenase complex dihydrolipoamide acetyltransferase [Flavobacteriales bacterium]|nr:pyruvate dehydrogenase complex dihydrolipoamide acetyltransferase [Flavobacteriales bacterium]